MRFASKSLSSKKFFSNWEKICFVGKQKYSTLGTPTKLTKDVFRKLPKAELHYHLDGSLTVETILELAKEQSVNLPAKTEESLSKLVVVPDDCPSLEQFLKAFDITLSVLQTAEGLRKATRSLGENAMRDGIKYLEIRFSPILHTQKGMDLDTVMESVCGAVEEIEKSLPITVRIIVCGMRQMDSSVSKQMSHLAVKYKSRGVVAFDLAGPEFGFPCKNHSEAFSFAIRNGLHSTVHAGESDGPNSIRDAIQFCGAERIGHGVALEKDSALVEEVKKKRIGVECCLTSNLKTKATPSIQLHPVKELFDAGVDIIPCTDDDLMTGSDLTNEYFLLYTKKGFNQLEQIFQLLDNGFKHSFLLDKHHKKEIRREAFDQTVSVLVESGFPLKSIMNYPTIKKLSEGLEDD